MFLYLRKLVLFFRSFSFFKCKILPFFLGMFSCAPKEFSELYPGKKIFCPPSAWKYESDDLMLEIHRESAVGSFPAFLNHSNFFLRIRFYFLASCFETFFLRKNILFFFLRLN